MLVAAPVLLVAFMLWPRISLKHGGFIPLALAGLISGAPILHDPVIPVPDGALKLKVYQHNIYVENIVFERIVNTVERKDPDIIALVEARDDTLAPWEARLQERWPYMAKAQTRRYSWARLRLFSKYPIKDYQVRKRDYEPATLHARVETPNGEITVVVAHFTRPERCIASHVVSLMDVSTCTLPRTVSRRTAGTSLQQRARAYLWQSIAWR